MPAPEPLKKIAVVGLGAIGGVFAAWLGRQPEAAPLHLTALARGATLRALRERGLLLHTAEGCQTIPLHASDDASELGPQDLVIVAVKAPALIALAPAIRRLMGPHTTVLMAMNGLPWWFFEGLPGDCENLALRSVDPAGVLAGAIPTAQVMGCVVHLSATTPEPASVDRVKNRQLIIGNAVGRPTARAQEVAALLRNAGFEVTLSERIQRDIWFKLWGNMTMNPVSALTGAPCDQILDDPLVRRFCSAVMGEAQRLGAHFGCEIDQTPEDRHAVTRQLGSFKTSMLQDVEAGRPIELDALLSAVQEVALHLRQETPNLEALLGLCRLMARQKGVYPQSAKMLSK